VLQALPGLLQYSAQLSQGSQRPTIAQLHFPLLADSATAVHIAHMHIPNAELEPVRLELPRFLFTCQDGNPGPATRCLAKAHTHNEPLS
jgi:hypothetical protein